MNEPNEVPQVMVDLIYRACREAVADENAVAWQTLLQPILKSFDRRLTEIERSLGLLIQGQALIEKSLAGAFDDNEPWKESLE